LCSKLGDKFKIKKNRPCVVIQNDVGNKVSPTTIIAPIRDAEGKTDQPYAVLIMAGHGGLNKKSLVDCAQIRTINCDRIVEKLGALDADEMQKVNMALKISVDLF
jgi:mRNA interferase MazF